MFQMARIRHAELPVEKDLCLVFIRTFIGRRLVTTDCFQMYNIIFIIYEIVKSEGRHSFL